MSNSKQSHQQQNFSKNEERCMKFMRHSKSKKTNSKSIKNHIIQTLIKLQSERRIDKKKRSIDTNSSNKFLSISTIE